MAGLLILVVALIVYGSLYPWQFQASLVDARALFGLLHSWPGQFTGYQIRDALINVILYTPVGASGYLALRKKHVRVAAYLLPIALGFGTSVAIEVVQSFEVSRRSSLLDVLSNTSGATIGVGMGVLFSRVSAKLQKDDRSALFVLACWVGYLLFPFIPVFVRPDEAPKLTAFLRYDPVALVSSFASWYTAGFLLREAGVGRVNTWLMTSVALVPAQLLILGRHPSMADLTGAILGSLFFLGMRQRDSFGPAIGMMLVLTVRELAPFRFQGAANTFAWIPFAPVIEGIWLYAGLVVLEKLYYCAAAIWALQFAGMRLVNATAMIAGMLTILELAQIHVPGRTPETTDAILAVFTGVALNAFRRISTTSETWA